MILSKRQKRRQSKVRTATTTRKLTKRKRPKMLRSLTISTPLLAMTCLLYRKRMSKKLKKKHLSLRHLSQKYKKNLKSKLRSLQRLSFRRKNSHQRYKNSSLTTSMLLLELKTMCQLSNKQKKSQYNRRKNQLRQKRKQDQRKRSLLKRSLNQQCLLLKSQPRKPHLPPLNLAHQRSLIRRQPILSQSKPVTCLDPALAKIQPHQRLHQQLPPRKRAPPLQNRSNRCNLLKLSKISQSNLSKLSQRLRRQLNLLPRLPLRKLRSPNLSLLQSRKPPLQRYRLSKLTRLKKHNQLNKFSALTTSKSNPKRLQKRSKIFLPLKSRKRKRSRAMMNNHRKAAQVVESFFTEPCAWQQPELISM